MTHPTLPGALCEIDDDSFAQVWRHRGWIEVAPIDPRGLTDTEVLAQVGADPAAARLALAREREGRGRRTLIRRLTRIADAEKEK